MAAPSAEPVRVCRRCLYYEGMPFILMFPAFSERLLSSARVEADGVCTFCKAYDREFRAQQRDEWIAEVQRARDAGGADKPVALVAYSGGKDSTAALYMAREVLNLPVVAVLLDNGHIDKGALAQAHRVCDRLETVLRVQTMRPAVKATFGRALQTFKGSGEHPCGMCAKEIKYAIDATAMELDVGYSLSGVNYFMAWKDEPIAIGAPRPLPNGRALRWVALPYLLQMTRADTLECVRKLGAEVVATRGLSSNCHVPAQIQGQVAAERRHLSEHEILFMEVVAKHLPRDEGVRELHSIARRTPGLEWMLEAFVA